MTAARPGEPDGGDAIADDRDVPPDEHAADARGGHAEPLLLACRAFGTAKLFEHRSQASRGG